MNPSREPDTSLASQLRVAEQQRDALRDRLAWWEENKHIWMFPGMLVGLLLGYLLGRTVTELLHQPEQGAWFAAVAGLLMVGKGITMRFDPSKLDAAQRRVRALKARTP
ncbi:MAG: hypothetical protein Q8Q09_27985 [Deltaproteobacteria bacterium]|nr:hypothetical protein [Deltaproteobacteria bacterium]